MRLPSFAVVAVSVVASISTLSTLFAQADNSWLTRVEASGRVIDLTNAERVAQGLPALVNQVSLDVAAQSYSAEMATGDFFSHTSPSGTQPWDRAAAAGYAYSSVGENIAAGYATPEEVVTGWMNSPGHRANILNGTFTEIGAGFYRLTPDTGAVNFQNYWTQVFGTPSVTTPNPVGAAFPSAYPSASGWYYSQWLGWFYPGSFPWVYVPAWGWLYATANGGTNVSFYDDQLGWFSAYALSYPYFWHTASNGWGYFQESTTGPSAAYLFATGQWVLLQ